jgi:uncharacterized protein (TIGR04222 family)
MKDLWIRNHHGTPPDASELEQRIVVVCNELSGCRFGKLVEHAKPAAEKIRHRLEAWGLMTPSEGVPACCWMPAALMAIGLLVGIAKLFVGWQRGKPVGFLMLMLIAFAVVTFFFFFRPLRTRAGDVELNSLRRARPELKRIRAGELGKTHSTDVALAAAMFGLGAVAYGEMAALPNAWKYRNGPPVGSDGSSSSGCGTSGCGGGGGCGGGCGGCS